MLAQPLGQRRARAGRQGMGAHSNNPGTNTAFAPFLAVLEKEVNPALRQLAEVENTQLLRGPECSERAVKPSQALGIGNGRPSQASCSPCARCAIGAAHAMP